jgi:8-oxo-dGTP pyrophosphatase MutT (NUDIX family)
MILPQPIIAPGGKVFIHARGNWSRDQVRVQQVPSTWRGNVALERIIEAHWQRRMDEGMRLFDGPICRFESFSANASSLSLNLSESTYKIFNGTNLCQPDVAERFGPQALANPVGVSIAVLTLDGWLLFGRRSESVVYYPHRAHPFAGGMEPSDNGDPFYAVERELGEEIALARSELDAVRCIGLVEDGEIRHPELIFRAEAKLGRDELISRLDREEHHETVSFAATPPELAQALHDPLLTPVGIAALLLWGGSQFGEDWLVSAANGCKPTSRA